GGHGTAAARDPTAKQTAQHRPDTNARAGQSRGLADAVAARRSRPAANPRPRRRLPFPGGRLAGLRPRLPVARSAAGTSARRHRSGYGISLMSSGRRQILDALRRSLRRDDIPDAEQAVLEARLAAPKPGLIPAR